MSFGGDQGRPRDDADSPNPGTSASDWEAHQPTSDQPETAEEGQQPEEEEEQQQAEEEEQQQAQEEEEVESSNELRQMSVHHTLPDASRAASSSQVRSTA